MVEVKGASLGAICTHHGLRFTFLCFIPSTGRLKRFHFVAGLATRFCLTFRDAAGHLHFWLPTWLEPEWLKSACLPRLPLLTSSTCIAILFSPFQVFLMLFPPPPAPGDTTPIKPIHRSQVILIPNIVL